MDNVFPSAAGAAFISAIIVNPLDLAKTRLQAQAAGVQYSHPLSNLTSRMAFFGPNMVKGKKQKKETVSIDCMNMKLEKKVMSCKKKRSDDKKKNYEESDQRNDEAAAPSTGYIYVRARRGQATDSHSLAERDLKGVLQDVPEISGVVGTACTAQVLNVSQQDEQEKDKAVLQSPILEYFLLRIHISCYSSKDTDW